MTIQQITAPETWALRHKVMWPNQSLDYIKLPKDEQGIHFGLFLHAKLHSVVSLFVTEKEAQFRKFATAQEVQGKGYGTYLLNYLIEYAKQQDIERIWCNARSDKTNFYQRFGLQETEHTFKKGGIDYVVMEKWE